MIKLKNRSLYIKDKAEYILSGEIHYFRIDPKNWNKVIKLAKQAGLNTIASYIPWRWHEIKEGVFDFEGKTNPRRNLRKWLKELNKEGIYFIPRIGPISNGEMRREGLPDWLITNYPETSLIMASGEAIHHQGTPSYRNKTFLRYVEKWYDKVVNEIAPYQIYYSGNIILVQLCNEIAMVNWLAKAPDYSEEVNVFYREFLEKKYKDINKLNKSWGSKYKNFNEINQPGIKTGQKIQMELWDRAFFYREYYAQYYKTLKDMVFERGIKVPVIANIPQFYDFDVRGRGIYSPLTTTMFSQFANKVKDVIFGGAYQMRRLDYENFHDILISSSVVEMISSKNNPVICAELQTGIMYDRPKLYPKDVELNLKESTASGLNGVNCYMFAGGTNILDNGQFGSYHEWQSPVDSKLEKKEHYYSIEQFGKIIKTSGSKISESKREISCYLGIYMPYYMTEYMDGDAAKEIEFKRNNHLFDGIARLLRIENYNFKCINLEKENLSNLKLPLFVYSDKFMDRTVQKKLIEFVLRGGKLILLPEIPTEDITNKKCSILQKEFDIKCNEVKETIVYTPLKDIYTGFDKIFTFETKKNDIQLAYVKEEQKHFTCGFLRKYGKGKLFVFGFSLNDKFNISRDYFRLIAKKIGLKKKADIYPDNLSISVRTGKKASFLFAGNFNDLAYKGYITYKGERIPSDSEMLFPERKLFILPYNYIITNNVKLIYASGEMISYKITGKIIKFKFEPIDKTKFEAKISIGKRIKIIKEKEFSIKI